MKVLVVEDEKKIAASLKQALTLDRHEVDISYTGEDAFFLIDTKKFDLIILDWMLPGRSGIEILKAIRAKQIFIPVIILTAKDDVGDRVLGLDSGADDYMVKPFAVEELLARVRSFERRKGHFSEESSQFSMCDLKLDTLKREVQRDGQSVELTMKEYDILLYMFRHQGRVVGRDMLGKDVWKITTRATPLDNVIDVHMARLRKKIDGPYPEKLIHTVRGMGFVLREA